jgi:hypothetical protein
MTAVPSDCATSDSHGNAGVSFTEVVTVTKKSKSQAGGSTNTKVLQSSGRNKSKAGVSITMDVRSHGHGTAPPSDLHGNAGVSFTEVTPTVKKRNMEAGAGKDTNYVTFKGATPPTESHGNAGVSFTAVTPTVKKRRNMEAGAGKDTINVTFKGATPPTKSHGNGGVSFPEVVPSSKISESKAGGSTNAKVIARSSGRNKSKAGDGSNTTDVRSYGLGTVPPLESHDAPGIVPYEVQQFSGNQTINVTISDASARSKPHDIMMPGAKESTSLAGSTKRDDVSKHVLNSFYKDCPMFLAGKKHGCIRCCELVTYVHSSSKHVVACTSKNPMLVNDYEESSVNEEEDYDLLHSVTSFDDFIQESIDFQTAVSGSLKIADQSTIGGIVLESNVGGNVNETNDAPLVGTCEEDNVYADSLIFNDDDLDDVEGITEMFNNAKLCAGFGSFGVPENIPYCDMFDDFIHGFECLQLPVQINATTHLRSFSLRNSIKVNFGFVSIFFFLFFGIFFFWFCFPFSIV